MNSKDVRNKISDSNPSQGLEPQNSKRHVVQNEEPRRSQRQRKEKGLDPDFISSQAIIFLIEEDRERMTRLLLMAFNIDDDPKTYIEAVSSRDFASWKEAINDEMDSLMYNGA